MELFSFFFFFSRKDGPDLTQECHVDIITWSSGLLPHAVACIHVHFSTYLPVKAKIYRLRNQKCGAKS